MSISEIIEMDKKYYMNIFGDRLPVAFEKGDGIKLYSADGEKYYDFLGGLAVSALGHNYMPLVNAIEIQAKKLLHTSNLYYAEKQAELAKLICENSCGDKAFFLNSEAEAKEAAIKLSIKYSSLKAEYKKEIIALKGSSLCKKTACENVVYIERNNIDELKNAINEKTSGIMVELMDNDIKPLTDEYIKEVRKICDEKDIVMIIDEVETGIGSLGTIFGYEKFGVEPDIFTLSKGLGGGVPIGAVVAKEKFCAFAPGDYETTFGGNPLACVAGITVITELRDNYILYRANRGASYFESQLNAVKSEVGKIKEIRAKGLMIGIEFEQPIAKEIHKKLFENNILAGVSGEYVLKVIPPLVIRKSDIDLFIKKLKESLS